MSFNNNNPPGSFQPPISVQQLSSNQLRIPPSASQPFASMHNNGFIPVHPAGQAGHNVKRDREPAELNDYDEEQSDSPDSPTSNHSPENSSGNKQNAKRQSINRSRPIRACTHCRQQKIKCNASDTFPVPCSRCQRMGRKCIVDPLFRPHKGGQVQSLRDDLTSLRKQVESLQKRESMLVSVIAQTNPDSPLIGSAGAGSNGAGVGAPPMSNPTSSPLNQIPSNSPTNHMTDPSPLSMPPGQSPDSPASPQSVISANSKAAAHDLLGLQKHQHASPNQLPPLHSTTSSPSIASLSNIHNHHSDSLPPLSSVTTPNSQSPGPLHTIPPLGPPGQLQHQLPPPPPPHPPAPTAPGTTPFHRNSSVSTTASTTTTSNKEIVVLEYTVGEIKISGSKAEELHHKFITDFLPYVPIIESNSADELYKQSHLLFWTVILTASLSEPEPSLYYSLCNLIKQMAIEACWLQTPRSTHVVQALCILGIWPLPNEKVLDDCSYRFVNLAKSVAMQLGLHRGKFIYEFSRSQTSLPDAEKWRTRTWLCIYFAEQVWSASLGLPPNTPVDYLVDTATRDDLLPKSFRSLLTLSIFYSKLATLMGSSTTSPDGLLDAPSRCSTLFFLEQELDRLGKTLNVESDPSVELYYRYMKLMLCVFAFLPGTSSEDQAKYIVTAFQNGTRIVTLMSGLVEHRRLIEYPIYMRQAVSFAALILFRLHLSVMLMPQYVESARQSVVTVHRLFRNMLTAWKDLENDISRTAKVLEKLNFVIITHPYLLTQSPGIITRMRSHLTASLFYELIWSVHEARRRGAPIKGGSNIVTADASSANSPDPTPASTSQLPQPLIGPNPPQFAHLESVPPLPFYNQITKDDFTTNTTTTPNGTTITTLVPTHPNATLTVFGEGSGNVTPGNGPIQANNTNNNTNNNNNLHLIPNSSQQPSNQHAQQQQNHQHPNQPLHARTTNPTPQSRIMGGHAHFSQSDMQDIYSTQHPSASFLDSTGASNDPLHLETLMQGIDWMNDNSDDFLGWMDINIDS